MEEKKLEKEKKMEKKEKKMEKKERDTAAKVMIVLQILVVLVLIEEAFDQNWGNVGMCLLTLILFFVPSIFEKRMKVILPTALEIIILFFIFAAEILGEVNEYYLQYERWDDILHTMNGFLAAAIGFALIDMLNKNEKVKFYISPFFAAAFAFCFSMTVAVFWEFFEFSMDYFFGNDMQKDTWLSAINSVSINESGENVPVLIDISSVTLNGGEYQWDKYLDIGLYDTMHDMFVNFIGATVFSIFGYIYIKNRGKGFAKNFIPQLNKSNEEK